MESEKKKAVNYLASKDLSYFCMQISLLMNAGILLEEGIGLMLDEGKSSEESELLLFLSEGMAGNKPFWELLKEAGVFPEYMVQMTAVGEASGNLDRIMEGLSSYYEKEHLLEKDLKQAITYPGAMLLIMFLVLSVLSTQVIPVFKDVFAQLSVSMAPLADTLIRVVALVSGAGLVLTCAAFLLGGALAVFGRRRDGQISGLLRKVRSRGRLSALIAKRRLAQVLAISLNSGLDIEEGFALGGRLVENRVVEAQMQKCLEAVKRGEDLADSARDTGLFTGMQGRLLQVGQRAGRMDEVLKRISDEYGAEADDRIDKLLSGLEPTLVAVLSVVTGGMLLLVMLPLLGVLAALG